jgi:shikimate dehydrogenase
MFIERLSPSYVDIEFSELSLLPVLPKTVKVIISFHDYKSTPSLSDLKKVVQKICTVKCWAVKVATMIASYEDLLIHRDLEQWLHRKNIRSIVLGMGENAHLSRLSSPTRNPLTYACLSVEEGAAPGQLTMDMYRGLAKVTEPVLFGIIGGAQIAASLSPTIHNFLFRRHRVDALYARFPTEDFSSSLRALSKLGVRGLSVTAPFKVDAWKAAAKRDKLSDALHSANTLLLRSSGIRAFNTDVAGIIQGYPFLAKARTVAILGAGGVVPSIVKALREMKSRAVISVFVRDEARARKTLAEADVIIRPLHHAPSVAVDTVICAISEDVSVPLPQLMSSRAAAIDLRYAKETAFMKGARKRGFRVHDGLPMLLHQALVQFKIFTHIAPSRSDVASLKKALSSNRGL